ncbi:MAG TPA: toll/interleukin-1 receptor domain-containing protein [Steroidobacteraceae bacterium]|nr:toll/interleukin-1 receptor domain-containing protein [Steroidobacteraceae bacterium]
MPVSNTETSTARRPTVFISYASEDRSAAQLIRDALPGFGLEVWYDESELIGGDAWDQKIRRQIRECDYFMPVISAHTEARHEGYFRREWRLAVERTLDMADDHVFLLPVVIDRTTDAGARVPDRFRAVQWLRVPDGHPNAALEALCRRLVSGAGSPPVSNDPPRGRPAPEAPRRPKGRDRRGPPPPFPPFPREEPGQRVRFVFQVAGWLFQWAWVALQHLPRWVRILVYVWAAIYLLSRLTPPDRSDRSDVHPPATAGPSAAQVAKLREIAGSHPGGWTSADTAKLLSQIAKEIPTQAGAESSTHTAVLAVPFTAPAGNAAGQKLAGTVFALVYGRLAIAHHDQVAVFEQKQATVDQSAVLQQARTRDATYILSGAVDGSAPNQQLTIKVLEVDDGSVAWSKSYPVTGADPAGIAAEVSAHVPTGNDDD